MSLRNCITHIARSDSRKAQIVRYVITGGLATAAQYAAYVILVMFFSVSAEISTVLSYAISFTGNFFLSNFFTFHTRPNVKKAATFATSHLINLGLQTFLVAIFKHLVGAELALLPAMALCIPVNFFLVRFALTSRRFQTGS